MKGQILLTGLLLCITYDEVYSTSVRAQSYMASCESRGTPRKYTEPPCDLQKNSYCTEPGEGYPKHAVRRFVSDNQGLMKRMYGEMRHLSVLRSEMEWNTVNSNKRQSYSMKRQTSGDDFNGINDAQNNTALGRNSANITGPTSTTPQTVVSTTGTTTTEATTTEKPIDDKGINACPIRQEVVAPYWAVNTRGKMLAIVNDPPYEQHIHWENCLHENQQMLCRDGCKCEQQHRLQRLLAFDPTCDCKGIFMDWFLLPSCCICRCYGMRYNSTENGTSGTRQGREENDTFVTHNDDQDYEWDMQNFTALLDDSDDVDD